MKKKDPGQKKEVTFATPLDTWHFFSIHEDTEQRMLTEEEIQFYILNSDFDTAASLIRSYLNQESFNINALVNANGISRTYLHQAILMNAPVSFISFLLINGSNPNIINHHSRSAVIESLLIDNIDYLLTIFTHSQFRINNIPYRTYRDHMDIIQSLQAYGFDLTGSANSSPNIYPSEIITPSVSSSTSDSSILESPVPKQKEGARPLYRDNRKIIPINDEEGFISNSTITSSSHTLEVRPHLETPNIQIGGALPIESSTEGCCIIS